ncbi:MAG: nucleoid-associated protein [Gammaproteobacteria bacterium]|nr:nucleoid-associated protein [Gammaproteobacteria bacterium]
MSSLAIVHQIRAGQPLRSKPLAEGEASAALLDRIKGSFSSRLNREHGRFAADAEPPLLASTLEQMLADPGEFANASARIAQALLSALDAGSDYAAYLFFFLQQAPASPAAYVFLVPPKSGPALDAQLQLSQCQGLDLGQNLAGIKIDIQEWQQNQQYAYLSWLPPRGNPSLTEAFLQLSGFTAGINSQEHTQSFLTAVEEFGRELPADGVEDFRRQVVDYCLQQERNDQPLAVQELAANLGEIDRQAFVQAMPQEEPIWLDRRSLQRYLRFSGREQDLAISFSSAQLNKRVRYDAQSDTLHISGLPAALRQQLLDHQAK